MSKKRYIWGQLVNVYKSYNHVNINVTITEHKTESSGVYDFLQLLTWFD